MLAISSKQKVTHCKNVVKVRRETHRETHTERHTHRQTQRERHTHRHRERHTHTHRDSERDRDMKNRQILYIDIQKESMQPPEKTLMREGYDNKNS